MSPAVLLRESLAVSRARGEDFATAWPAAIRALGLRGWEGAAWKGAFNGTRAGWERAYNREPATAGDHAPAALATALDV